MAREKKKRARLTLARSFETEKTGLFLDANHQGRLGAFLGFISILRLLTAAATTPGRAIASESRDGNQSDTRQTEKELFHIGTKHPPGAREVKWEKAQTDS